MTDAHCHVPNGETRHFLCSPRPALTLNARDVSFCGVHPWFVEEEFGWDGQSVGVGEIGLDRLRNREISPRMRDLFARQLAYAFANDLPLVLHGAKCWGEVVQGVRLEKQKKASYRKGILFHGFSRSWGLLPEIVALNGYVSVGPAVLNLHAENYRAAVKTIPLDRLLVESDRTPENAAEVPSVTVIAEMVAKLRGMEYAALERQLEENADRFLDL